MFVSENQRAEVLLTEYARQLTTGGGKPGQGYPMVMETWPPDVSATLTRSWDKGTPEPHMDSGTPLIFSAEGSPARTCPSPDDEQDSPENDPASSTSSPESQGLFDPDGYSSRTYPDCSPAMAVGTSESCLERWPTSGTAWHGGLSTHVSSECRSDADACSSSEPSLTGILEPPQTVPVRYSLSARAARGILRRAEKRGRMLPSHLSAALARVALTTTADKADDS